VTICQVVGKQRGSKDSCCHDQGLKAEETKAGLGHQKSVGGMTVEDS
jgi:hypothetical protein